MWKRARWLCGSDVQFEAMAHTSKTRIPPRTVRAGATQHMYLKARHGRGGVQEHSLCRAIVPRGVGSLTATDSSLRGCSAATAPATLQCGHPVKVLHILYEGTVGETCGSTRPAKSSFFSFGVRMNCTDNTVSMAELKAERMAGISWLYKDHSYMMEGMESSRQLSGELPPSTFELAYVIKPEYAARQMKERRTRQ